MRRIVIAIIVFLAVAFVFFSLTELQSILDALQKSKLAFLLAAGLIAIISMVNTSVTFGTLYRLVGLMDDRLHMFLMATAANFVNIVAPGGGVGGLAVFLDEAHRRNISTGRVMVVGLLYLLYEYASLLIIISLGFTALSISGHLNPAELVAAGFVLALALGVGFMLFLGYRSSERLGIFLARLSRLVNSLLRPILHHEVLRAESAREFSLEIAEGITALREGRKNLVWPLFFTLNNKALLLCILACTFLALGTPFTIGTLIGGFSISMLFIYATPTPSGIGFVEGLLPAALNNLSVPFTEAVLITLAYRAVTFWLPFAAGALAFHSLQSQGHLSR